MKVLFNNFYGGFELSDKAKKLFLKRALMSEDAVIEFYGKHIRTNKTLIEVVEELGDEASAEGAEICIAEIPDGAYFHIEEYDGLERVLYSMSPICDANKKEVK